MRIELQQQLEAWSNDLIWLEQRTIITDPNPVSHGEYIIRLKLSTTVRLENQKQLVEKTSNFLTSAQSLTTDNNPNGDLRRFEIFQKALIDDFFNSCNKVMDEFLQNAHPDGHF